MLKYDEYFGTILIYASLLAGLRSYSLKSSGWKLIVLYVVEAAILTLALMKLADRSFDGLLTMLWIYILIHALDREGFHIHGDKKNLIADISRGVFFLIAIPLVILFYGVNHG